MSAPWGRAGVVWPMPGAELVGPNPAWARTIREAGFTWIRMDVPVSRDRANAEASIRVMQDAGLQVLPILSWPSAEPDVVGDAGLRRVVRRDLPRQPLGDARQRAVDPRQDSRRGIPAHRRADGRGARGCPSRRARGAGDGLVRSRARRGARLARRRRRHRLHRQQRAALRGSASLPQPVSADVLAVAFARQGVRSHRRPARASSASSTAKSAGSRTKAAQACGEYHVQELDIATHHRIPLVGIYCHIADLVTPAYDFGLWLADGDVLTPRPAATTVSAYLQETAP